MRMIIAIGLLALVGAACGAAETAATTAAPTATTTTSVVPDRSLEGAKWQLLTYGLEAQPQSASPDVESSIVFDDGEVSGKAPCNSFSGTYEIRDDEIMVDIQAVTRVACADDALDEQEQAFFAALRDAQRFDIIGDRMKIEYGQGLSLVFDAA